MRPLSTLGVYCQRAAWPQGRAPDPRIAAAPAVPLRHAVIALLSAMGVAVDEVIGLDSAPLLDSLLERPATVPSGKDAFPGVGGASNSASAASSSKSTSQFNLTPDATSLHLLEYLISWCIGELAKPCAEPASAEEGSSLRYFLCWTLGTLLRLLWAQLVLADRAGLTAVLLGLTRTTNHTSPYADPFADALNFALPYSSSPGGGVESDWQSPGAASGFSRGASDLLQSFVSLLSDCIGFESGVLGVHSNLISHALLAPPLNGGGGAELVQDHLSTTYFRHDLRLLGISAYAALVPLLPAIEADSALLKLLQLAPLASHPSLRRSLDDAAAHPAEGALLSTVQSLDPSFYVWTLLQKITDSEAFLGRFWKSNASPQQTVVPATGAMGTNDYQQLPRQQIEQLLLRRLAISDLLRAEEVQSAAVSTPSGTKPLVNDILFAGELRLLRAIQRNHVTSSLLSADTSTPQLVFSIAMSHPLVQLSDDRSTVTFRSCNKSWATVVACYRGGPDNSAASRGAGGLLSSASQSTSQNLGGRGISPGTGVHEWIVKITNCDQVSYSHTYNCVSFNPHFTQKWNFFSFSYFTGCL